MAITTFTENMDILAALDNEPNDVGGLTPEQAKAKFDEAGNTIKDFFNESLIPELDAAHLPYEYGGENTIKDTLDGVVLGTIPDNSLTYEKMNPALKNKLDAIDKNTINLLRLKLQGTLAVPDIDAWCDLFADEKQLNLSGCSDVWADGFFKRRKPFLRGGCACFSFYVFP